MPLNMDFVTSFPTHLCSGLLQATSVSPSQIKGTHTTPKKHYVDDLTISFTNTTGCSVDVGEHVVSFSD